MDRERERERERETFFYKKLRDKPSSFLKISPLIEGVKYFTSYNLILAIYGYFLVIFEEKLTIFSFLYKMYLKILEVC